MARKKLFGAAAKAHARRLAKVKRRRSRRNPLSAKQMRAFKKHRARGVPAQSAYQMASGKAAPAAKRKRIARKAAATRRKRRAAGAYTRKVVRKKRRTTAAKTRRKSMARRKRSKASYRRAALKGARRRKARGGRKVSRKRRRNPAMTAAANPRRRRRRRNPGMVAAANPKRRRRRRRNPFTSRTARAAAKKGWRMRKRRRSAARSLRRGGRSSSRAGRYLARYRARRNPNGIVGGIMETFKAAVPVAGSLYLSRFIANKLGPKIPMVDKLGRFSKPAVAAVVVILAHFATKTRFLSKWRGGIMLGTGINLVDSVVSAVAPENVKSMFGLGQDEIYDEALSDYVEIGADPAYPGIDDYVEIGDDGVEEELGDYIEVSAEEDLGADDSMEEELGGFEQDMGLAGPLDRPLLGGVGRGSLLRRVPSARSIAPVPTKSYTKDVPAAGAGYDKPGKLYTGIFSGGFGC